jgi:hypothetical protein
MNMDPQKLLKDLIAAVLAWEEADAIRGRIADSKSATAAQRREADVKLMAAIRQLRAVARALRVAMRSAPKKKGKGFNWMKALDITTMALNTVKEVTDKGRLVPTVRVIDATAEVVR